jgi:hypothetical protein
MEMQDLGDKVRMVVMGHRRIRINSPLYDLDDIVNEHKDDKHIKNGLRRRGKRASSPKQEESPLS